MIGVLITRTKFLGQAIYNLWFHPLARYPGPFFTKISSIPNLYHACTGNRHVWLWQLHEIYGLIAPLCDHEPTLGSPSLTIWQEKRSDIVPISSRSIVPMRIAQYTTIRRQLRRDPCMGFGHSTTAGAIHSQLRT